MINGAQTVKLINAGCEFAVLDVGYPGMRKIIFAVVPIVGDLLAFRLDIACRKPQTHAQFLQFFSGARTRLASDHWREFYSRSGFFSNPVHVLLFTAQD